MSLHSFFMELVLCVESDAYILWLLEVGECGK